jgi:phosphoribosylformylglycinamidine cyclo-ligase
VPRIFELLARHTGASIEDQHTTFNMGIGMVLVVDAADATAVCRSAAALGEQAYVVGRVHERPDGAPAVLLHGGAG